MAQCGRCCHRSRRCIASTLYSPTYTAVLLALTLYSLYGDDARIAAAPATYDYVFVIFTCITLVAFLTEIMMQAVAKDGYFPLPAFLVAAPPKFLRTPMRSSAPAPTSPSFPTPPVTPQLGAFVHNNVDSTRIAPSSQQSCWAMLPSFVSSLLSYMSIGSFALWIDLASTISVALEITVILHGSTSEQGLLESSTSGAWISLARAGRASRAGARIGRLLQLLRLWRMFRSQGAPTVQRQETRVGSQLTDLMTRRVIIGVLLCVLVIPPLSYTPIFSAYSFITTSALAFSAGAASSNITAVSPATWNSTLTDSPLVEQGTMDLPALGTLNLCGPYSPEICRSNAEESIAAPLNRWIEQDAGENLVFLSVNGVPVNMLQEEGFIFNAHAYAHATVGLREVEQISVSSSGVLAARAYCGVPTPPEALALVQLPLSSCAAGPWIVAVYVAANCPTSECLTVRVDCTFSRASFVREAALWSTGMTTLVVLVLAAGAALFSYDINRIVLRPLEYMIRVVQQISDNPLVQGHNVLADMQVFAPKGVTTRQHGATMEVKLLLRTLLNIGSLLRMAFGESGAKIITNRLNNAKELNPVGPGKRIYGIFVFVQLQHMPVVMAALQEETLLFVNFIADVVHSMAVRHRGIVVNNTSDGITLLWPLPVEDAAAADADAAAEQAVLCVLRIFFDLAARQQELWVLGAGGRNGKQPSTGAAGRFWAAFPERNLSDFVAASCHCGWALEGPLGSDRKLDAAWLSPHITYTRQLASVLLAPKFNKAAPLRMLITHPLYALLSPRLRTALWWVTRVGTRTQGKSPRGFELSEVNTKSSNDSAEVPFLARRGPLDLSHAFFAMDAFAMLTNELLLSNSVEAPRVDPMQIAVSDAGKLCISATAANGHGKAAVQRIFITETCAGSYEGLVDIYSLCLPDEVLNALSRNDDIKLSVTAIRNIRRLVESTKDDSSNRFTMSPRLRAMSAMDAQPRLSSRLFNALAANDASIVELIINMQQAPAQHRHWTQLSLQQSLWAAYIQNDGLQRNDAGPLDADSGYAQFCDTLIALSNLAQAKGYITVPADPIE